MQRLFITCAQQRMLFGRTSSNRVSRFVEEIPDDDLDRGYVPRGYGYSDPPRGFAPSVRSAPPALRAAAVRPPVRPVLTPASAQAAPPAFQKGETVEHKSFGRGLIVSMTPMGGDFLVEIAFDNVGTKRLMLKAASRLMKKV